MQSCSVHHCVLLLLTLTFTTAPVLSAVCSKTVKLHQPVTLSCEYKCSGSVKWSLFNNRDVVFARCDETSCSSLVKGYNMSYDQYQDGDLSLTITAADYRMRNTYSSVFSAVQVKHDGDLILDLTVPEPVEVIYTSSDSADGERICNVTQHSLQCKAEYTHRTSLRYPELTLRDVTYSDSGRYTIRDTENKEDIRVYSVSVTDDQSGFPVWGIIVMVLILLAVFTGVFIYLKMAPHQEFLKLGRQLQCVDKLVKQSLPRQDQSNKQFIMTGAALKKAEKEIDKLQQQYTHSSKYSEQVSLFCQAKRSELNKYRVQYRSDEGPLLTERDGIIGKMEEVMNSLQQLRGGARREQQVTSSSSTAMDEMEIRVEKHLEEVEKWCGERRVELNDLIQQHRGGAARDLRLVEIKS
ncbi:uncharacterized protein LOC128631797 isoform X2 [Ictalurus punctatus]|uniref:Uncharacterized protein LOC128631797 isoform X2 n=1 Tax=Ictalurus punctatus TaxID=7998 RepID=A0A9F7TJ97_ICTPU|nr:uncharacterized protein LOC128631797 isoform X2 [Ictalurus punctatus]